MSALEETVRAEIEELHAFFVEWYNGTAGTDQLEPRFLSHLDPEFVIIPPEGRVMSRDDLDKGFSVAHGNNKAFRIQIRDVKICHELRDHVVATYTEWQFGAKMSPGQLTGRISTVLMTKQSPLRWLHVQETWLPEEVRAAGSIDI